MNASILCVVFFLMVSQAVTATGHATTGQNAGGRRASDAGGDGGVRKASFADFDARARAGESLSVVFFGGSLTWGANSSDPQRTSYRALMADYLRAKYPHAPFTFWDASIGGTGSRLGVFRIDRDVLSRNPDLVFLDFTANDNIEGTDAVSLDAYESLLRRLIGQGIPVEQCFFGFKSNFGAAYDPAKRPRQRDHLQLAAAYHTAIGDCFPYIQAKLTSGETTMAKLWPIDGAHPDDPGYELFFEAVRNGFEQAIAGQRVCQVPRQPVFGDDFMHPARIRLVDLPDPPRGWTRALTHRTSMWFDGLSSRWMGDVLVCGIPDKPVNGAAPTSAPATEPALPEIAPLKVAFRGTFVGLFGEGDPDGLGFGVKIDGVAIPYRGGGRPAQPVWPGSVKNGRLFIWRELADHLAPGAHELEIDPILPEGTLQGQLRIESICAGGADH
jgi:lysophospholipase L1-like esterase